MDTCPSFSQRFSHAFQLQTPTGRLVWAGHDHAGNVCVWFSDDGGETYTTAPRVQGNEISIALADADNCSSGNCTLYMNGRGGKRFGVHRTDYYSYDNGQTWTTGSKNEFLLDDGGFGGCEASVVRFRHALYFLEPQGKHRTDMRLYCSLDNGKTWPHKVDIDSDHRGGYSDAIGLPNGKLLAVWEDGSHPLAISRQPRDVDPPNPDSGNFFVGQLDIGFCSSDESLSSPVDT